jgi:alcohol dehydrogenase class IV
VPAEVTSSCGLDVVCHAVESFVSKPYDARERPETPDDRPPYQGANPVSDVWSAKALEYGGQVPAPRGLRLPTTSRRAAT